MTLSTWGTLDFMSSDYDLVVVGVGPAGEKGAAQAAYFGKRVACVERAAEPGGAAVHTGTLPSKTLRETALFLSGFRQRELYGLSVELNARTSPSPSSSRARTPSRDLEVARIQLEPRAPRRPTPFAARRGSSTRTPSRSSIRRAQPRRIASEVFLVATGSTPHHPPDIPFDDEDVDDSDTILQIDRLPKTMLIVGGGVIGCEYASMFAAMHVEVTLVEGRRASCPSSTPRSPSDCAARCRRSASTFHLGRDDHVASARVEGRGIVTTLDERRASSSPRRCSRRADAPGATRRAGARGDRRRGRQARLRQGRRRLPDGGAERLRGGRRHRLPGARLDVDGAGARRGVPRVRLHLQAAGVAPPTRSASTRSPR